MFAAVASFGRCGEPTMFAGGKSRPNGAAHHDTGPDSYNTVTEQVLGRLMQLA